MGDHAGSDEQRDEDDADDDSDHAVGVLAEEVLIRSDARDDEAELARLCEGDGDHARDDGRCAKEPR